MDYDFLTRLAARVEAPRQVAVVGAGRWGRVWTKVLGGFAPAIERIHLVAEHNFVEAQRWLANQHSDGKLSRVGLQPSLQGVLDDANITAALVTKMAAQHFEATRQLLRHGKHVLVEKPFVLRAEQASTLAELAESRKLTLAVGHEYLFSSNFHHLRGLVDEHFDRITGVKMVCEEPANEARHGQLKRLDWSSNVITNLYPHILSQLQVILGSQPIEVRRVHSDDSCWSVELELLHGDTPVDVALSKLGTTSRRIVTVTDSNSSQQLTFDYTAEPGQVVLNGKQLPSDPLWDSLPKPLTAEVAYFFNQITDPDDTLPVSARSSLPIVAATEEADKKLQELQLNVLENRLIRSDSDQVPSDVVTVLRHQLLARLFERGLVRDPKSDGEAEAWIHRAWRIVRRFAAAPWTKQEQVLRETQLPHDQLRALNGAIRSSDFLQQAITERGLGRKYWSTVLPLFGSGAIQAVLDNEYRYPLRTGLYPGVSCMFFCTFCGRDYSSKYPASAVSSGNEMLKAILTDAPDNTERYISLSGGLEPLTNPGLGELIAHGRRQGVRLLLITNGYSLNPRILEQQPGLWDLDTLRISLYGVDEPTYLQTTRKKGAFDRVRRNLIEFLTRRNAVNPNLKVGLNHIILGGCVDQVLPVFDLIEEVNGQVSGGPGIDFVTLREDFNCLDKTRFTAAERGALFELLAQLKARHSSGRLGGTHIDYGYSLFAIGQGITDSELAAAQLDEVRSKGYPQISVAIDLYNDVYLYREAAFLNRPGADRYRIGRVTRQRNFETVVREFLESGEGPEVDSNDLRYLDAFDHVVAKVLNQAQADIAVGIPPHEGPVRMHADASARKHRAARPASYSRQGARREEPPRTAGAGSPA